MSYYVRNAAIINIKRFREDLGQICRRREPELSRSGNKAEIFHVETCKSWSVNKILKYILGLNITDTIRQTCKVLSENSFENDTENHRQRFQTKKI